MRCALAVITMAACWSERAPPRPPIAATEPAPTITSRPVRVPDRCETVVRRIYTLVRADSSSSRFPPGLLDELEPFSIVNCREMAWSDETLDCYTGAASINDSSACYRLMTSDQRSAFEKQFSEVLQRFQAAGQPTTSP